MKVKTPFGTYKVTMEKSSYHNNGNLAIRLYCSEGPFATLTVNLEKLPKGYAYVDTNNCPWAESFISENNLGRFTGEYGFSGFCSYPLYNFNPKKEVKKTGHYYTLVNYFDVWGNAKDGWEINNQCVEVDDLYLDDEITYKEILDYLKNAGYLVNSDMRRLCVESDGTNYEIYKRKGMEPLYALMMKES